MMKKRTILMMILLVLTLPSCISSVGMAWADWYTQNRDMPDQFIRADDNGIILVRPYNGDLESGDKEIVLIPNRLEAINIIISSDGTVVVSHHRQYLEKRIPQHNSDDMQADQDNSYITAFNWHEETASFLIAVADSGGNIAFHHINLQALMADIEAGNELSEESVEITQPLPEMSFAPDTFVSVLDFSPDGNQATFTTIKVPENFDPVYDGFSQAEIVSYIANFDNGEVLPFADDTIQESGIVWSPDSTKLAYATNQEAFSITVGVELMYGGSWANAPDFPEIYFYDIASQTTTALADGNINFSPRWLSATQLVYMSLPPDETDFSLGFAPDINLFDLTTDETRTLVDGDSGTISSVEAAPDGTKIAYSRTLPLEPGTESGFTALGFGDNFSPHAYYIMDVNSGNETRIYDIPLDYMPVDMRWLSDSQHLDISYLYLAPELLLDRWSEEARFTTQYTVNVPIDAPQDAEVIYEQEVQNPVSSFMPGF